MKNEETEMMRLLQARRSVRNFLDAPLLSEQTRRLKAVITMINTHEAGLYFSLVENDGTPFDSYSRFYGTFRNVGNYVCCVVDESYPHTLERAGYYGEQIVAEALKLGISCCFVSATFNPSKVDVFLRAGRRILYLIAVGFSAGSEGRRPLARLTETIVHRKKMSVRDFYECGQDNLSIDEALNRYPRLEYGLQGVACAPSAYNKRPVRIGVKADGSVFASVKEDDPVSMIDLGIAKFNFEAAWPGAWDWGNGALFFPE